MYWVKVIVPLAVSGEALHACLAVLKLAPPGRQFFKPFKLLVFDTELPTI